MDPERHTGVQRRARKPLVVAVAVVAALCLPACGGDDPAPDIEAAFAQTASAFRDGNREELCRSLSPAGRLVVGTSAHEKRPLDCPEDIQKFLDDTEPYRTLPGAEIVDVTQNGDDQASADVRVGGGTIVTLPFSRIDGRWKPDGLHAGTLSLLQTIGSPENKQLTVSSDVEPADGGSVSVHDAERPGRPPCPEVRMDPEAYPPVEGGCVVEFPVSVVEMSVWTPFGVLGYGGCEVSFDLHVDGDGAAWIANFLVGGQQPCVDTVPCYDEADLKVPWAAEITRGTDGRLLLSIDDVCLDTCMGRFRGRWDFAMAETARGWRLRFPSMLGDSGWRTEGSVSATAKTIAVAD